MADAANSAGDLLIDAVVFYTIKEARKKPTPQTPWGRGKIEPLGALTIGGVLLATGAGQWRSERRRGTAVLEANAPRVQHLREIRERDE